MTEGRIGRRNVNASAIALRKHEKQRTVLRFGGLLKILAYSHSVTRGELRNVGDFPGRPPYPRKETNLHPEVGLRQVDGNLKRFH